MQRNWNEPLCTADGTIKWPSCYRKLCCSFSKNKRELPYDPKIPLLDIYTKALKTDLSNIRAVLLIIAKLQKTLKCLSQMNG